jgi:hypothetical protein
MSAREYTRFELAHNQLAAAIALYITNRDRLSAITLAGAADVILSQLVLRSGAPNFTDRMLEKEVEAGRTAITREIFGREINDMLFINQLKHFDDDAQEIIELDVDECALAAILKALANYVHMPEYKRDLVLAFNVWVKQNLDPQRYNIDCNPTWSPPPSAA